MLDSNMSQGFWAEAKSTANYIRNRCSSNSIDGKTPFEYWTGRIPNLKHVRTFGCRAVTLNKNPARGKFDPRGRECILIGYSDIAKAYRVWYPSERKVEATRDIVFLENSRSNMKYDDFIEDSVLYKQNENDDNGNWTYVDINNHTTSDEDTIDETDTQEKEPEETSPEERRGPGRPRIIRTGGPGRPRKVPPRALNRKIDEDECNYAEVLDTHVLQKRR